MYFVQVLESKTNIIIHQQKTLNELKAMEVQKTLEATYDPNKYYTEKFCSDCGGESCCC